MHVRALVSNVPQLNSFSKQESPSITSSSGQIPAPSTAARQPGVLKRQISTSSLISMASSGSSVRDNAFPLSALPASSGTANARVRITSNVSRPISASKTGLASFRNRTTSLVSPMENKLVSPAPRQGNGSTVSRVPVPASTRRLGSVQSPRNVSANGFSGYTPRPTQAGPFALAEGDDSPGLDMLVANTTVRMQDLADMLSPLAPIPDSRKREEGNWTSVSRPTQSFSNSDEEEELEDLPSPSKSTIGLKRSHSAVSSGSLGSIAMVTSLEQAVPKFATGPSLSLDGLPLLPSTFNRKKQIPVAPRLLPTTRGGQGKTSLEISDLLSATSTSPSREFAADSSTRAMRSDLSKVVLTPLKRLSHTKTEKRVSTSESELRMLREEAGRQNELSLQAAEKAKENLRLRKELEEMRSETHNIKVLLARQAGDAVRLVELDKKVMLRIEDENARRTLINEIAVLRIAAEKEHRSQTVQKLEGAWNTLKAEYGRERITLQSEFDMLEMLKSMLAQIDYAAKSAITVQ